MVSESLTLRAIRAEPYPSLKSTSKIPGCDGTYASIADMEDTIQPEHRSSIRYNVT